MKSKKYFLVIILIMLFMVDSIAEDNQKLAQASFHFLSVVSDAKAAAMASAVTSLQIGSSALFFNPAGMSRMEDFIDISTSHNQWIADIKHYTFSTAISPWHGDYGVLGVSLQYVDYGSFIRTYRDRSETNERGYIEDGIFKLSSYAVGIGYAKRLTDQFSVGGQIRWAEQNLGESRIPSKAPSIPVFKPDNTKPGGIDSAQIIGYADSAKFVNNKLNPLVFDFGTQFRTGFKSLVFGMSVRNFSKEIKYAYEGFQLPLVFTLGISMDIIDLFDEVPLDQSLYLSIDASHYRDHPEQLKIGIDYCVLKLFSLRLGYSTNTDEAGFSFGLGVRQAGFSFDYSYTPYGIWDKVQRITARFSY